jgi:CubicO group peptidase (beta-lactamase class C family)
MRTTPGKLAATVALATALIATAALAQPEAADDFVAAELERQRIPGVSIAVSRDGELLAAKGYGFANVEHRVPATADTVYQTGSIGKQLAAALVMILVEENRISLDDRLVDHIDGAPESWSEITVRHMLNHTAACRMRCTVGSICAAITPKTSSFARSLRRRSTSRRASSGATAIRAMCCSASSSAE